MLGVDDRLITPATIKWVKVGLVAGLATIPTTILLYWVLGLAVDAAWQGSNMLRQWFWLLAGLVLLKATLAWLFRTGQFRASSEAKLNVRDQIYKQVVRLGPGLLGKRRTGEIANTATEGVEYLDYYFSVYFVQIWVAIAIPIFLCSAIFWIDWVVGVWMLAGVPLTPLFVGSSARGFRRISAQNAVVKNRNSAQYLDSIQGMSTLKSFNQAIRRGQEMEAGNEVQRRTTMKLLLVAQSQFVFLELGFALFSTAVAMGVALYRYTGGFMTPGEVVAVVHGLHVPAVRLEPGGDVLAERERRAAVDADAVVIVEEDEVAELQVAGEGRRFRRHPFHQIAVAAHPIDVVVDNRKADRRRPEIETPDTHVQLPCCTKPEGAL